MLDSTAAFRKWRREDQKPKVSLGYPRVLRPAEYTREIVKLITVIRISVAQRHMHEVPELRRSRPARQQRKTQTQIPLSPLQKREK